MIFSIAYLQFHLQFIVHPILYPYKIWRQPAWLGVLFLSPDNAMSVDLDLVETS